MAFPTKQFTEEQILDILSNLHNPCTSSNKMPVAPCLTLHGVATALGCTNQTARKLLDVLVASGRVIRCDLGTKGKPILVYYLPGKK